MSQLQQLKISALDALAALPPRDRYLAIGMVLITFFAIFQYSFKKMLGRTLSFRSVDLPCT